MVHNDPFEAFIKMRVRSFKYKNLTILFLSLCLSFFLFKNESFHSFLLQLGTFGYLGAFVAGILFVSTFTVTTGVLILLVLAERLSVFEIGIIAGFGAVIGDLLIFRFIKNDLVKEVKPIYNQFGGSHISKLLHSRYFSWTLPVFGAILIASPFPDELGISLMGLSRIKTYQFIALSFGLNTLGIIFIIASSIFVKP